MIKFENTKNALGGTKAAVAAETKRVMLRDIGAKWGRLTEEDIATIWSTSSSPNTARTRKKPPPMCSVS